MLSDILFEIAICVFIFLLLGIIATIFEFRKFIHTQDKSWPQKYEDKDKEKDKAD